MRAEKSGITDVTGKVRVARLDDAIVVTMPGTNYSVIYRRVQSSPWLLASDLRDDPNSSDQSTYISGSSMDCCKREGERARVDCLVGHSQTPKPQPARSNLSVLASYPFCSIVVLGVELERGRFC